MLIWVCNVWKEYGQVFARRCDDVYVIIFDLIQWQIKSNQMTGKRVEGNLAFYFYMSPPLPSSALLCFPSYEIMLLSNISILIVISYNMSYYALHSHSASILKRSQSLLIVLHLPSLSVNEVLFQVKEALNQTGDWPGRWMSVNRSLLLSIRMNYLVVCCLPRNTSEDFILMFR